MDLNFLNDVNIIQAWKELINWCRNMLVEQTSRKLKKSVGNSVRQDVKICQTETNSVRPNHVKHKIRRHFDCRVPKSMKWAKWIQETAVVRIVIMTNT
jgi:hypothetical protein